jgi:hypothetical protein
MHVSRRTLLAAPLPVALSLVLPTDRFWPVVTDHPRALEISTTETSRPLRRFNAPRPAARADNPTRRHVGVDLFANAGDTVLAIDAGRIIAFYPFLRAAAGEMSFALIVAHETYVANYGEVRANSLSAHGLSTGDAITAGREIAAISDTSQLHFETYAPGATRSVSWRHGAPQPTQVRDPTALLTELARDARRFLPRESVLP